MMRETAVLAILFVAAVRDAKTRKVPNAFPVLIALCSLIPGEGIHPAGILACVPFLLAGVTCGGIGGADVKTAAALGIALGFRKTFGGLILGLLLLVAVHGVLGAFGRRERAYPLLPFLFAGTVACAFIV